MWFRWSKGRQQSGYDKMLLATAKWPFKFDLYLLRFPEGAEIPGHTDPVAAGRHYRLNIVVKKAVSGGEFWVEGKAIINTPRIKFFRPDVNRHGVSRVNSGSRYVLSFGFLT